MSMVLSGISPGGTTTYEGESHKMVNEEVIIEHEHARDSPNSLMIIRSCINMVDEGLHDG